jgi:hypothetical protein
MLPQPISQKGPGRRRIAISRHCEERSDEAIQFGAGRTPSLDCFPGFAGIAMT